MIAREQLTRWAISDIDVSSRRSVTIWLLSMSDKPAAFPINAWSCYILQNQPRIHRGFVSGRAHYYRWKVVTM